MKPIDFALSWHCDPLARSRSKYDMVEINGAYKDGRYDKSWLNSLHVMSNIKAFATQDGQLAGQPAEHPDEPLLELQLVQGIHEGIYEGFA